MALALLDLPAAVSGALLVAVLLPAFWAWGHFQAHVAMSPDLDEADRARWRVMLACVPGAMAGYWWLYVR